MSRQTEPKLSHAAQRTSVPRHSKSDVRHWKARVFKRSNDDFHVQISFMGRRERFPLKTPNKNAAAVMARDIYDSVKTAGWDAALAQFKPWTVKVEIPPASTVGEFLKQVQASSDLKAITFTISARKFRRLVSGVMGLEQKKDRHDHTNGGSDRWRAAVDGTNLADLTDAAVPKWKLEFLAARSANPLAHKRAKTTVASVLRSSKSLFCKKVLKHLTVLLPAPVPFSGVTVERSSNRYRSRINPALLAQAAKGELEAGYPELYKIFVLALGAGLRRDEIDTLTWKQFDWTRGVIRIETNVYTTAKTEESEEEIDLAPELVDFFKAHTRQSGSEFVANSAVAVRPAATYHHYRCNALFRDLVGWLRRKGVETHNPLHTLRKEYGSMICHARRHLRRQLGAEAQQHPPDARYLRGQEEPDRNAVWGAAEENGRATNGAAEGGGCGVKSAATGIVRTVDNAPELPILILSSPLSLRRRARSRLRTAPAFFRGLA